MSNLIIKVTDASFDEDVLNANGPILVDFWADWCGPCKAIAPILDEIAKEYEGKLTIAKVSTEENSVIPVKYGVRGIPTLIIFNAGEVVSTRVGAPSKSELAAFIDSNI